MISREPKQRITIVKVDGGYEYHLNQSIVGDHWRQLSLDTLVDELRAEGFTRPEIRKQLVRAHTESVGSNLSMLIREMREVNLGKFD